MIRFSGRIFDPMEILFQKISLMIKKHEEDKEMRRRTSTLSNKDEDEGEVKQGLNIMDGFRQNCEEIGNLFDQANILVKTISVARMALLKGNDN